MCQYQYQRVLTLAAGRMAPVKRKLERVQGKGWIMTRR
jgi:hypothetical protein